VHIYVKPHKFFTRAGNDLILEVPVSFVQAALGDEIEVPTLKETIKLKIPAGTQGGSVFRIRGRGIPDIYGHGKGDMHVRVSVVVPSRLTERQKELLREFAEIGGESQKKGKGIFQKVAEGVKERL